ncbi:MAG TPA: iron-containing alcohol dehydrogenase [Candidatus Sulfotelmatobacter sp.]|nr:iron-containing alcohol dehydrogenase [Candidatus Sulfotelmatobacter sp.]
MKGTFTYANPKVVHWGAGSVDRAGAELARLGARRAALVTTRSLVAESGLVEKVRGAMGEAPTVVVVTISQHAPLAQVDAAVEKAADAGADSVVSFGGGSAIDAAKMLAIRLADRDGPSQRGLPHVAIPTTLSVAELAGGAGYTNTAGDKAGMRDPRLLADVAIYDAELTLATPIQLWLSTGIRALDHAVEGFLADGEHPFSDALALESIRRLFESLPRAKAAPRDLDVRTDNQLAAWFSFTLPGQSASGLSHVMGKQIGARHGIPHGVTSCLLLPHVIRYLARREPRRVAALEASMGRPPADAVQGLISSLELPQHIAAYGIGETELRRAAGELAGMHAEKDLLEIYMAAI